MSVRRATIEGLGELCFPHGVTLFTTDGHAAFAVEVERWQAAGLIEPYSGQVMELPKERLPEAAQPEIRFVGTPGMNSVCKFLAATAGVTFNPQRRVISVGDGRLDFNDTDSVDGFDSIIVACPAPQTAELLRHSQTDLSDQAAAVVMRPTWAVMLAWPDGDEAGFDAARVTGGAVSWLFSVAAGGWVAHMNHNWSNQFLEALPDEVAGEASKQVANIIGKTTSPTHATAHRWRYASAADPIGRPVLHTADRRVVVAGDWLLGDKVADAWRSGWSAAEVVLRG